MQPRKKKHYYKAKYFVTHVQIQHSFMQRPHSEILHLRKEVTDLT